MFFLDDKQLGGYFFVEKLQKVRKRSGKLSNRDAQRLPKGGWGASAGAKDHRSDGKASNFWWPGAAQSILDTKILRILDTKILRNQNRRN